MKTLCGFLTAVSVVAYGTGVLRAQGVWVNVLVKGQAVMSFVPANDRSGSQQRGVCSVIDETGATTKDGAPIRAFAFTGWGEGDGYLVRVFAIVARDGQAAAAGPCSEGDRYKRVEFADLHVKIGHESPVKKMAETGVTPWVITVGQKEVR